MTDLKGPHGNSVTSPRPARRAVIVGSGISGLAAALTLHRAGWQPLIVERAPRRRTGGYFVRFFGPGYAAAERLGILDALPQRTLPDGRMYEIARSGRVTPGITFPSQVDGTPLRILLRSDLERVLYDEVHNLVEIRYGVGPAAITQDRHQVTVTLTDRSVETADLLIGADGIHSTVRSLVFGPEDLYRKDFDHAVAACVIDGELPGVRDGDTLVATAPGRSAWINTYVDHPPVAFLLYRTPGPPRRSAGIPPRRCARRSATSAAPSCRPCWTRWTAPSPCSSTRSARSTSTAGARAGWSCSATPPGA
ncbi:FAD-dependent monooxygenase [Streptomyces sp. FXJ1.4098]|nr:FAD-dependent monooxygenase [Streptomyces sp. FXJ1.4098]